MCDLSLALVHVMTEVHTSWVVSILWTHLDLNSKRMDVRYPAVMITDSLLRAESRYEEFIFQNTVGTFFFGKHQIPHPASVKYKQDEINHLLTLIINGFSITFIHVTFAKCWTAHFGRKHFISTSYLTWTYEIIIRNSDHLLYTSTGKSSPRKDWDWSWMLSPAVLL